MLRLLADENVNGDIVRGLLLREAKVDIGLLGEDDPEILAWAAANNRILLTHDRATMPDFVYERILAGEPMPGMFVLNDRHPVGEAIQEILLLAECSEHSEWSNRIVYLPL